MANEFMTMGEASKVLGLTKARISQLASSGSLKAAMVDGRKQVSRDSVQAYLAQKHAAGRVPNAKRGLQMTLMSADYEVARVSYEFDREFPFAVGEILDPARMPLGTVTSGGLVRKRELNDWWEHRSIPDTRPMLLAKKNELGVSEGSQIPIKSYGLSLSDCYWLKPDDEPLSWDDLNYYENDFDGAHEEGGAWLTNVGLNSPDNTSEGELPKRWIISGGRRVLLKGSGLDDQRPYNECVATALHARLLDGADYVPYTMTATANGPASACPDFLNGREEYIPALYLQKSMGNVRGFSAYDRLCRYTGRLGADEEAIRTGLSKMIVCDSILANGDRHWRNFGFIRNVDTLELRLAPIFDTGNCLWYGKTPAEISAHDWTFSARPFGPEPARQLAVVDRAGWFDSARLEGFVEEAIGILAGSEHAAAPMRRAFIEEGLTRRVSDVSAVMAVLAADPRRGMQSATRKSDAVQG